MKQEDLLLSRLARYGTLDIYPFHMPGHKRRTDEANVREFPNPFGIDITEIHGFDNLHHPEGILRKSMDWAARVYGADRTYYLVNGSTGGILSAIGAAVRPGEKLLMGRNSHKSAYHGVILAGLQPVYLYPQVIEDLGIQGGILPEDVDKILDANPDVRAVLVVSPTYDGVVSDVAGIARAVHRRGIPLIVDEAHGAHFSFGGGHFPASALDQGADAVIQSLHKTLPSLTQTAVLHVRRGLMDLDRLERYLQMFQTSSPSYVFLASIEHCIWEMAEHGAERMEVFAGRLNRLRTALGKMNRLKLLGTDRVGSRGVFGLDPSKIVVSCRGSGCGSGADLDRRLRQQYGLEMEMAGADYVVAITTCMDSEAGLKRLEQAFLEIDRSLAETGAVNTAVTVGPEGQAGAVPQEPVPHGLVPHAVMRLTPCRAVDADWEEFPLDRCAGRISTEFIYLYPPGIPIVAPGELVTGQIIAQVRRYQELGLPVQGPADADATRLRVVRELGQTTQTPAAPAAAPNTI